MPEGAKIHQDHIFPQKEIKSLDGFSDLTADQQRQLLNDQRNLQPMVGSFNCSKGCSVEGTINSWDTYKGQPINPEYSKWLRDAQDKMRDYLQMKINKFRSGG